MSGRRVKTIRRVWRTRGSEEVERLVAAHAGPGGAKSPVPGVRARTLVRSDGRNVRLAYPESWRPIPSGTVLPRALHHADGLVCPPEFPSAVRLDEGTVLHEPLFVVPGFGRGPAWIATPGDLRRRAREARRRETRAARGRA